MHQVCRELRNCLLDSPADFPSNFCFVAHVAPQHWGTFYLVRSRRYYAERAPPVGTLPVTGVLGLRRQTERTVWIGRFAEPRELRLSDD